MSTDIQDPDKTFVYVKLYIMLGDADGSIKGAVVTPRLEWEADLALFQEYLDDAGISESTEREYSGYSYNVKPSNWKIQYATPEEAAVLSKFLGTDSGFRWPSEFVD